MGVRRYGVFDENGVKINTILISDPMPKDYWPGYGAYLRDEGNADPTQGDKGPDLTNAPALPMLPVDVSERVEIGDSVDLVTATVTKFEPQIVAAMDEKGEPVVDEKGEAVTVALAADVKLETPSELKAVLIEKGAIAVSEKAKAR